MIRRYIQVAAAVLALTATPALAQTTVDFVGATDVDPSYTTTSGAFGVNVTAYTFLGAPSGLDGTNLGDLTTNTSVSISANGVGVCTEGGSIDAASGECPQVDTNGTINEALYLDFSGASNISITSAILNIVDNTDTLGIYGVALDGTLNFLGFAGTTIASGGLGFTSVLTNDALDQYTLTFNPAISGYSEYLFTSTTDSADGYRLRQLTIAAVPELEVWAMLILGFGAIGMQMRRRRGLRIVTA